MKAEKVDKICKTTNVTKLENKDSFEISSKRSPLMWFALLQIPILIGMVTGLYMMFQNSKN